MEKVIVWYNPNKKNYYYKIIKGYYSHYEIGYKNNYDHEIILIIDNIYTKQYVFKRYISIRYLVLTPVIFILRKLLAFLQKLNIDN